MTQQKCKYYKPKINKIIKFESNILAGSVIEKTSVTTTGQEVIVYDFNDNQFNHDWQ